ncbi:hypothetical protein AYI69_g8051 [Smittium culicis]|uniref:Uncharacterized protein n=1 Tax=Smittium culicis TaxID=133412 RepID=A0A1R1XML7_9FUNG|nr:hypothetical protein AYI69_g8051 [Smittium culicis]
MHAVGRFASDSSLAVLIQHLHIPPKQQSHFRYPKKIPVTDSTSMRTTARGERLHASREAWGLLTDDR